jgi:hypothetical protein
MFRPRSGPPPVRPRSGPGPVPVRLRSGSGPGPGRLRSGSGPGPGRLRSRPAPAGPGPAPVRPRSGPGSRPGTGRDPAGGNNPNRYNNPVVCVCRESDVQHVAANNTFHTAGKKKGGDKHNKKHDLFFCLLLSLSLGFYYRPASLKSMTVLMGNTEKRVVYKNFELQNLHQNLPDYSHTNYEHYLETNYFIPPGGGWGNDGEGKKYWAHTTSNLVPTTVSTTESKGLFNVFPLDLLALDAKNTTASSLGKSPPPPEKKCAVCYR